MAEMFAKGKGRNRQPFCRLRPLAADGRRHQPGSRETAVKPTMLSTGGRRRRPPAALLKGHGTCGSLLTPSQSYASVNVNKHK